MSGMMQLNENAFVCISIYRNSLLLVNLVSFPVKNVTWKHICLKMKHFFYTAFVLLATFAAQKSFIVCAIKIVIP